MFWLLPARLSGEELLVGFSSKVCAFCKDFLARFVPFVRIFWAGTWLPCALCGGFYRQVLGCFVPEIRRE